MEPQHSDLAHGASGAASLPFGVPPVDEYSEAVISLMYMQEQQSWIKNETNSLQTYLAQFEERDHPQEGTEFDGMFDSMFGSDMALSRTSSFGDMDDVGGIKRKRGRIPSPSFEFANQACTQCSNLPETCICLQSSPPKHLAHHSTRLRLGSLGSLGSLNENPVAMAVAQSRRQAQAAIDNSTDSGMSVDQCW